MTKQHRTRRDDLATYYDKRYRNESGGHVGAHTDQLTAWLLRRIPTGSTVLDLGCVEGGSLLDMRFEGSL